MRESSLSVLGTAFQQRSIISLGGRGCGGAWFSVAMCVRRVGSTLRLWASEGGFRALKKMLEGPLQILIQKCNFAVYEAVELGRCNKIIVHSSWRHSRAQAQAPQSPPQYKYAPNAAATQKSESCGHSLRRSAMQHEKDGAQVSRGVGWETRTLRYVSSAYASVSGSQKHRQPMRTPSPRCSPMTTCSHGAVE